MTRSQVRAGFDRIGVCLSGACAALAAVWAINRNDAWSIVEAVAIAVPGAGLAAWSAARILGWVIAGFFPNDRLPREQYEALIAEFSAMGAKKAAKEWGASKLERLRDEFLARERAEGRYNDIIMDAVERVRPYTLYGTWVLAWLVAGWAGGMATPLLPRLHSELGLYDMSVADWEVWGIRLVTLAVALVVFIVGGQVFLGELLIPQIILNLLERNRDSHPPGC